MTDDSKAVVRPSQENKDVANYYLGAALPNVALQAGRLRLGKVASHITTTYYLLKRKLDVVGKDGMTPEELDDFIVFSVFVENKLPEIAAQTSSDIVNRLISAFENSSRIIVASGPQTGTPLEALFKEREEKHGDTTKS